MNKPAKVKQAITFFSPRRTLTRISGRDSLRGEGCNTQCYLGFSSVLTSIPLSHVNQIEQKTPKFRSKGLIRYFYLKDHTLTQVMHLKVRKMHKT
jgi:hypothetical protein